MKNLVIVESPAKAKTIEKFLGSDFHVVSSMGHIRALPSRQGSVDVANDFAPVFEVTDDKKQVVSQLKKLVKDAQTIWLASDEDREGEAIAWHLAETLNIDPKRIKRIVFHEITQSALDEAIRNPRSIDSALVEAQQARQSLDYLVGFELSPVLWRKVRPQLSAGRVQSVAVRLIVERERELAAFEPESTFKLTAEFTLSDGTTLKAESPQKYSFESARVALEALIGSDFIIRDIVKKPGTRNPSAPFTTSTLQQEASSRIGFSPGLTMRLAQKLYEAGHITYMRTDSQSLSKQAMATLGNFITEQYGQEYYQARQYKTKAAGAQEAHEAIRPTDVRKLAAGADEQQKRLYDLIWRRTVASQMAPAQLERTVITIGVSRDASAVLEAKGEVVVFDGFLKAYGRGSDDTLLPDVHAGDSLDLVAAEALENLSRGPARYTEASLIKKLEEEGIGRPSTYASTISTIQSRGYVERADVEGVETEIRRLALEGETVVHTTGMIMYGKDTNKLIPTDTGIVVTDFLIKHFGTVVDYAFTRSIEEQLDDIAEGAKDRVTVLNYFYNPFHELVEQSAEISRAEATQTRQIGTDPESGLPIFARYGRYGPMLQKGEQSDDPKPDFAPLPTGATIASVTLEQALRMFKLPRLVGLTESGEPIKANIGRFGPYIQVGKTYVSIKPLDPHTITEAEARDKYAEKLRKDAEKHIQDFGDIKVLNGRFGPYVTDSKKNAKVPKDMDPASITEEQAEKLLAEAPVAKGRFGRAAKRKGVATSTPKSRPKRKTSSKRQTKAKN